jgi:hypothetical protein
MNAITKSIIGVFAVVAVIIVARYVMQQNADSRDVAQAKKEFQQMQADAQQKHPDLLPTIALHQEVQKKTIEKLSNIKSEQEKLKTAADHFFGFYFNNTRSRYDYCQEKGVDIQSFVDAFAEIHTSELKKAQSVYQQAGIDAENLWVQIKPMVAKVVEQDMQDTSKANKITLEETCRALARNAKTIVPGMHLSKSSPAVYQVLSQAR